MYNSVLGISFSMKYLEKLEKLRLGIPRLSLHNNLSMSSDFVNFGLYNKNCYLIVSTMHNEDCFYGLRYFYCKDCSDCLSIDKCELCYESLDLRSCYNVNFCQDCIDCSDCDYCFDCTGCQNCFGCVTLRNQEFCILNKEYHKEEYEKKKAEILAGNFDEFLTDFESLKLKTPRKFMRYLSVENVTGDYIYYSKNVIESYFVHDSEDIGYSYYVGDCKDCFDVDYDDESQMDYFGYSLQNDFDCIYCAVCWYSSALEYCEYCFNCKDCFLCCGLQKKQYYILNKSYEKGEYFKEKTRIRAEMIGSKEYGEFFKPTYKYEDTVAAEIWG